MNDSFGGGFTQSGAETKNESKAEGTIPIFIKMLQIQADVDTLQLFGQEYKMVTLVAVVKDINYSSTKISYELEDWTGRIFAHLWIDEDVPRNNNIMINSYVRVIGGIRSQDNKKSIMIYKIHPVSGINEVGTHYIEVVNARFASEEIAGGKGSKMDIDSHISKANNPGGNTQTGDNDMDELSAKEKVIFKMIQGALESGNEEGYSRDDVYKRFPHFSRDETDSMLNKMTAEGLIYTTIDTDHFQACF